MKTERIEHGLKNETRMNGKCKMKNGTKTKKIN
jgi:hypothetical protein